jgi:hypothetical protein
MLFHGGLGGTVGILLLGVAATGAVSLLTTISVQQGRRHIPLPLHLVVASTYLILLSVVVDELPSKLIPSKDTAWFFFGVVALASVMIHSLGVAGVRRSRRIATPRDVDGAPTTTRPPNIPERATAVYALVNLSVSDYRTAVAAAEQSGVDFRYIQRRIAPYFNTDSMLRAIAQQRFGAGNQEGQEYVAAHRQRREAFFAMLEKGARYREIFPRAAILQYVRTGTHAEDMWPLTPATVVDLLNNWRDALLNYPNYHVAISDEALPIKYHVIDENLLIIHEPVGRGDTIRFNSFFTFGESVAKPVAEDFDLVWSLIDPLWRDREHLNSWIVDDLVPLAQRRQTRAGRTRKAR